MCPAFRHLFWVCKQLKNAKKIYYYSFFNGNLHVSMAENGTRELVSHINDLVKITGLSKEDIDKITKSD